jgi:hypothetical protein
MVLKAKGTLKTAQLPFKTCNFRSDFSLIVISNTGEHYSEETLALTFALKTKMIFPSSCVPGHIYFCVS